MTNHINEHLRNPDEVLTYNVRVGRAKLLHLELERIDRAYERVYSHMVHAQEMLGNAASQPFVAKDYTPQYEASPSEPKQDAFEKALAGVGASSKNTTPGLDVELINMLVEQSYIDGGIQAAQDHANNQGVSNVR